MPVSGTVKVAGAEAAPFERATTFVAPCGKTTSSSTVPEPYSSETVAVKPPLPSGATAGAEQ